MVPGPSRRGPSVWEENTMPVATMQSAQQNVQKSEQKKKAVRELRKLNTSAIKNPAMVGTTCCACCACCAIYV